ncbi:hypothetical protein D3C81_2132500 [compost metagenome]
MLYLAGFFGELHKGGVCRKRRYLLIRYHAPRVTKSSNVHVMLDAMGRNDDISNLKVRMHGPGNTCEQHTCSPKGV